jgi:hypothetical protein
MKKETISLWHAGQGRTRVGRERPAIGVHGHANAAQIWTGFGSPRTPRPSIFGMGPRVGPRFCPFRPIRTRRRGMDRRRWRCLSNWLHLALLGSALSAWSVMYWVYVWNAVEFELECRPNWCTWEYCISLLFVQSNSPFWFSKVYLASTSPELC